MCYNIIAMRGHDKKAALAELSKLYPDARPALHYGSAYELLVAVILSAQCTDERVNKVTEKLFERYNNPSIALGQRVWNLQPIGGFAGEGISPVKRIR